MGSRKQTTRWTVEGNVLSPLIDDCILKVESATSCSMMSLPTTLKLLPILLLMNPTTTKFSCPGAGFYADPLSCISFYRCLDRQTSYKYQCPSGTRYDPRLRNCNHEASAPPCQSEQASISTTNPTTAPATTKRTTTAATTIPTTTTSIAKTTTRKSTTRNPFIIIRPSYATQRPKSTTKSSTNIRTTTVRITTSNEIKVPSFPPPLSTPIPEKVSTSNRPPNLIVTKKPLPSRNYTVSPISLYACSQPDFYPDESSCEQFYTCRETSPGVLSADRIFRCPEKYLFDSKTHLCQAENKVFCLKNKSEPFLFYTVLNALVVQLKEDQLEQFFSSRLQLPIPRPKTVINPKVNVFGDDENPYPWVIFQSSIHK